MSVATISPAKLAELAREGRKIELIDVRTPVEFREVHLEIARNVPLDQLDPKALMQARNGSGSEPLYVICKIGRTGPAGLREVHQGRLHQCRQRRGRHDGLHRGGLAGRSRQEGHFAGAASSHRRRIAGVVGGDRMRCWLSSRSSGCRHSSAPAWCSPESPTPAGWACSWPACRGTSAARKGGRAPVGRTSQDSCAACAATGRDVPASGRPDCTLHGVCS